MIINCAKLDRVSADQVVLWLKANGCDYHTPIDGKIILRGKWIETPVIEKITRERAIRFDDNGPIVTAVKRFRQRFPLSAFRTQAEALHDFDLRIERSTANKREASGRRVDFLEAVFDSFGGVMVR